MDQTGFITSPEQLNRYYSRSMVESTLLNRVVRRYPMKIPAGYLANNGNDVPGSPLWKMAVPSEAELSPLGQADPGGEKDGTVIPGLQHAYPTTALLLATDRCFLYCRYCFRKRMVGGTGEEVLKDIDGAVSYIRDNRNIDTVLFSGGDPFCLSTEEIDRLLTAFEDISHLRFIRFATRSIACFPQRILDDPLLLETLARRCRADRRIHVICQINHPDEISPQTLEAAAKLMEAGACLHNQAVLLRGINDRPEVLAELMNRCAAAGIYPYYLYQCRPQRGVAPIFQVPIIEGVALTEKARSLCGGLSNRFRYVMSHRTGKIEILGCSGELLWLRYIQARSPDNAAKTFSTTLRTNTHWID